MTFRDTGAAFMVALLGIYILVVAQFGSFKVPARHPDADPPDLHRHPRRTLAFRRGLYRDLLTVLVIPAIYRVLQT